MHLLAVALLTAATVGRQPQLASDGSTLAMVYGNGDEVLVRTSDDGGRSFAEPVRIAAVEKLMLGRHRGPRIAISGNAIVVTGISSASGDLLAFRSTDRGKTWTGPVTINSVPKAAREGLNGLSANAKGTVFVTWLDDRDGGKTLYGAVSRDGGAHWSKDFQIYASPDGHVCECCHPSAFVDASGDLYAMWRNWLGGSRDMWLARSTDGGRTFRPEKLGTGTWPLNACPMDGGGLTAKQTIWRRADHVFTAAPGGSETDLGPGKDPTLAPDGTVAWVRDGEVIVQRPGAKPHSIGKGGYPSAASKSIAWENEGQIYVYVID